MRLASVYAIMTLCACVAMPGTSQTGAFQSIRPNSKLQLSPAHPAELGNVVLRSSSELAKLLLRHKRARDWESATSTLWWATDRHEALLNAAHVNIVISTCATAKPAEWERAIALLEQMPSLNGLQPDAYSYSAVIAACARAGQTERALAVFRKCSAEAASGGPGPNSVVFNAMLLACQRGGRQWQAELLAIFASMGAHGVTPDAWAYSTAIAALSRRGQWERALGLLAELEQPESSTKPDQHCYSAAMRGCLRASQWAVVLDLYNRARATGLPPSSYILQPALSACAAAAGGARHDAGIGGWRRAQEIMAEAMVADDSSTESLVSVHCFSAAARAYEAGGQWQLALSLLKEMLARKPPIRPNAHTFTAVIGSLRHATGQWHVALRLLAGMSRVGAPADAHAIEAALKVLGQQGRWRESADLLNSMEEELGVMPSSIHLTTVLHCHSAVAKQSHAHALLKRWMHAPSIVMDERLCEAALAVCGRACASSTAREVLTAFADANGAAALTTPIRCAAVLAMCKAGDWAAAMRLLPPPVQAGCTNDAANHAANVGSHNAVLMALMQAAEWDRAAALLHHMHELGPLPDTTTEQLAASIMARFDESRRQ